MWFFVLFLKAHHIVSEIVKNNTHAVFCLAFFLASMCLVYLYMRAYFLHLDDVIPRDIALC